MDKVFLCLANSYKHGGRCIAGIEVDIVNGTLRIKRTNYGVPSWVRPISHSMAGEVPNSDALGISVFSVVKIHNAICHGQGAHSEDFFYDRLEKLHTINPSDNFLRDYIDNWHPNIFGNRGKAVHPDAFANGDYSVMLVRTTNSEIYLDSRFERPKARIKFQHNGNTYDFPITDPDYLDKLHSFPNLYKEYSVLYIVCSLGVEHEGWHSKLAATIILPATVNIRESVPVPSRAQSTIASRPSPVLTRPQAPTASRSQTPVASRPTITRTTSSTQSISTKPAPKPLPRIHISAPEQIFTPPKPTYTPPPRKSSDSGGCYVATAVYGSYDCPQVWTLRRYRDNELSKTHLGRLFIKAYYAISPWFVRTFGNYKWFNNCIRPILDRFVYELNNKGVSNSPYDDIQY